MFCAPNSTDAAASDRHLASVDTGAVWGRTRRRRRAAERHDRRLVLQQAPERRSSGRRRREGAADARPQVGRRPLALSACHPRVTALPPLSSTRRLRNSYIIIARRNPGNVYSSLVSETNYKDRNGSLFIITYIWLRREAKQRPLTLDSSRVAHAFPLSVHNFCSPNCTLRLCDVIQSIRLLYALLLEIVPILINFYYMYIFTYITRILLSVRTYRPQPQRPLSRTERNLNNNTERVLYVICIILNIMELELSACCSYRRVSKCVSPGTTGSRINWTT